MVKNDIVVREEIESIVKKSAIDRKRFFEVDKLSYQAVQNRVVAKFINTEKQFDFNLHHGYLRYNRKLRFNQHSAAGYFLIGSASFASSFKA